MDSVRGTWRAMSGRSRLAALALAVVVVGGVLGGGALVLGIVHTGGAQSGDVEPTAVPPGTSLPPLPPTPSLNPNASLGPSPSPTIPGADPLLGTDGRLTVLLMGSDYRPAHPGNRTDAIMVVSIDPTTGKVAAFSIPRDTTAFPLPGGGTFNGKVNALYQNLLSTTKDGGSAMENAVSKAFGIEIDAYAFIGFSGVRRLVNAVGGVDVVLGQAYYDPDFWVTSKKRGWGLPAGKSHLNGDAALIMARSRKGDNDFGRARRQQILVAAALTKVKTAGPGILPRLLAIAQDTVRTDLPLARAVDILTLLSTADLSKANTVVFGPLTYATGTGGTSFALKIAACKHWIAGHFPPARPLGTWPASSSPVPSAAP